MNKITRRIKVVLQLGILVFVVFLANLSTNKEMATVSSDASNRVINLTTMAMKLEEDIRNDLYSAKDSYTGDLTGY